MKYWIMILCVFSSYSFTIAQVPDFISLERIGANEEPIEVDVGMASPCVTDWDGDGKKDLIVGQFGEGKVRFYKNYGKNNAPRFRDFKYLQADGQDISVSAS